jgi:hypothetical protein
MEFSIFGQARTDQFDITLEPCEAFSLLPYTPFVNRRYHDNAPYI